MPLAASLEWNLGQEYLRLRGNKAFLSDQSPVPFVVNNDGTLSRNAAEVFFASLEAAEKDGTLEDEIVVLELGIGVGLFARFFLDTMRELSRRHKKDYYDRLTYIAADRSERMLLEVLRHGVLGGHPGRYCVRQVDALEPAAALAGPVCNRPEANRPVANLPHEGRLRAVFLNYLLDCLPAAVLHFDGDAVRQLCVRTCVARKVRLADYTDLTADQLRQRANRAIGEPAMSCSRSTGCSRRSTTISRCAMVLRSLRERIRTAWAKGKRSPLAERAEHLGRRRRISTSRSNTPAGGRSGCCTVMGRSRVWRNCSACWRRVGSSS